MRESSNLPGKVADRLLGIEIEMRRIEVWSTRRPSDKALASSQPFCVDTLEFTEWLQFVFLERMRFIVEQGHGLPSMSGIAPMAEEYFRSRPQPGDSLIRELYAIDELLSDS